MGTKLMYSLLLFLAAVLIAAGYNPAPNPDSVVVVGKARFTVLTSHIVRMEWGGIVDNATFSFINRHLPAPAYNVSTDGGWTTIKTSAIQVIDCMCFANCYLLSKRITFDRRQMRVTCFFITGALSARSIHFQ